MSNINKIVVFGCSYMKGSELVQKHYDDINAWAKKNFNSELGPDGAIPLKNRTADNHVTYYHIERADPDWEHQLERLTVTYIARQELGIKEYKNYAVGGYSNVAIFAEMIRRKHEIDDNTLVILNCTYPFRSTRLNVHWDTHTNHPKFKTYSVHKFTQHLLDPRFKDAIDIFDSVDDIPTRYVQAYGLMQATKAMFKNVIILDTVSIYRETPDLIDRNIYPTDDGNGEICVPVNTIHKHITRESDDYNTDLNPEITGFLQKEFNRILFPYTFAHSMVDVRDKNEYYRCVLTHPNWKVHELFAHNYLIPYIKENYNV